MDITACIVESTCRLWDELCVFGHHGLSEQEPGWDVSISLQGLKQLIHYLLDLFIGIASSPGLD
jgi:hypothetical protein